MYLDGIEWIVNTIQMDIHTTNTEVKKDKNTTSHTTQHATIVNKPRLLTKPTKVPTWTRDLILETFSKQIKTWSDILQEIPEYVKYTDLVESLKMNKDIKGLPKYIWEHILPVLENKEDQTIKKVLEIFRTLFIVWSSLFSKIGRMCSPMYFWSPLIFF